MCWVYTASSSSSSVYKTHYSRQWGYYITFQQSTQSFFSIRWREAPPTWVGFILQEGNNNWPRVGFEAMRNPATPPNRLRGWQDARWLARRRGTLFGFIYYHNNPCYFKVLVNSTQLCSMYFCLQSRISFSRGRNITFRVLLTNNTNQFRFWWSFEVDVCCEYPSDRILWYHFIRLIQNNCANVQVVIDVNNSVRAMSKFCV